MLEELKKEVCLIAKRAQDDGLCKHKSGNFSARDKQSGHIVLTPAGKDRNSLQFSDMIVVDNGGHIVENLANLKVTSEMMMHLKIYEYRSDIHAVVHTHSKHATTFAILNKAIPAIVYEAAGLGLSEAKIPVAPYARPGTSQLGKNIRQCCETSDSFLLEKHGVVAIGTDIYDAFLKAAYIEELAEIYHLCLSIQNGKEPEAFEQVELSSWEYPKEIEGNERSV